MQRRDFVRVVAGAVAAPNVLLGQQASPAPPLPAPVLWTLGLNPATPIPKTQIADEVAQVEVRFFTPLQMATLVRLSDVFFPALGNKPGALAAETPAFLDFLIGSSEESRRKMYQGGLDWLDAEAKKKFSKSFAQLETAQADTILQPWMRTWMTDHPPTEPHAAFVNVIHDDIREATVNSKVWSDSPANSALGTTSKGLYWSPIDPDLSSEGRGRAHTVAHAGRAPA